MMHIICLILLLFICGIHLSFATSEEDLLWFQFVLTLAYHNKTDLLKKCTTVECIKRGLGFKEAEPRVFIINQLESRIEDQLQTNEPGTTKATTTLRHATTQHETSSADGFIFRLQEITRPAGFTPKTTKPHLDHKPELTAESFLWQKNTSYVDYATCGTFPACSIERHGEDQWSFFCDSSIVSVIASISVILSAIVTFSNIVIIMITLRSKNLRKPHGYFKLSLASADLIAGMFVLPSIIHNILTKINYEKAVYEVADLPRLIGVDESGSKPATFFGIMSILSTITAVYSLFLLSADSFSSVMWPMKYKVGDVMTSKKALIAVAVVWLVSLIVAIMPIVAENLVVYGMSSFTFQYIPVIRPIPSVPANASLLLRYSHAFVYSICVWGIPFIITWILTLLTFMRSLTILRDMRVARKRSIRGEGTLTRVDKELVRTVVVVLSLFTITIVPTFAAAMATLLAPPGHCYNSTHVWLFFISTYVLICGRFINVIVYNVMNKEFRTASRKFFSILRNFILCRKNKLEEGLPKRSLSSRKSWSLHGSSTKSRKNSSNSKESVTSTTHSNCSKTLSLKKSISISKLSFKKSTTHNNNNNNSKSNERSPVTISRDLCQR